MKHQKLGTRITIIGMGRTGSRLLPLLLAKGARNLKLVDRDVVEETDRQSNPLYRKAKLLWPKAQTASIAMKKKFPKASNKFEIDDLRHSTADAILKSSQVICDCTDNWATRRVIARWAWKNNVPWVYCGALKDKAMVATLMPKVKPCWQCWNPAKHQAPESCTQEGFNPEAGENGARKQCTETLMLAEGEQGSLTGSLWFYDASTGIAKTVKLNANPNCSMCSARAPAVSPNPRSSSAMISTPCGGEHYQFINPGKTIGARRIVASLKEFGAVLRGPVAQVELNGTSAIIFPSRRILIRAATTQAARKANETITKAL